MNRSIAAAPGGPTRPGRWLGTTALGVALATIAPAAFAQDGGAQDDLDESDIQTIIVTAQFREQNLQDTPIAITAMTSQMLEERSQQNLADIANQAPSVSLRQQSASFGPSISASIRGMGQIDFNPLLEPGVGLYIDDVYFPRLTGANFELVDVERVEVLRGPQGTLTGRNSEGGAIRYISKKPDGTWGGYGEATYGSRDRVNLRGALQFPIAGDLSGRVSGAYGRQDGYVTGYDYGCLHPESGIPAQTSRTSCKSADYGNTNYYAGRVALRLDRPGADIELVADYTHDSTFNAGEVLLYADNANPNVASVNGIPFDSRFICGRYCNYSAFQSAGGNFVAGVIPGLEGYPLETSTHPNRAFFEGWGVSLHGRFELADWANLTTITAYRGFDSDFSNDTDLSPARLDAPVVDLRSRFFSHEMRLNAELGEMVEATLGSYFAHENTDQSTRTDIRYVAAAGSPIYPLQFLGGGPVKVQSFALFSTVFVRPTSDLTLTLGGRYTDEAKSTTYERLNYDGVTPNAFVDPIGAVYGIGYQGPDTLDANANGNTTETVVALNGLRGGYKGTRFDYRASLDYRLSDEVLVYATTSTGFKGGGISPRPFNAEQVQPFGPEELTAYELGIKTDLFHRRLRLNVSGYLNKFTGAQLGLLSCPQFGGPGPCAMVQNAGDATILGLEAELSAEPIDGLDINASGSYLDWSWDCVNIQVVRALAAGEANACSRDRAIVDRLVAPPRGVTRWQWSLGAQYRVEIAGFGSLTPRLDVSYQGRMAGGALVPAEGSPSALYGQIPSYTLTNARLTYRTPDTNWQLSLAVTNLFDRYYFSQKFDLTGAGAGLISGTPARPREWALTVKRNF
ncbi:TonB-dependent receptor [Novosphingobium profundi]|uniref:TonB-dependent receptor n=1 Tax=Novosphingobium profundi TaxID=1774954 RepID=UPI001BDB30E6|nr:TonB-dependent receptor [Novosphingobium profundi]MBT0669186.1 TonB-dependent receptor [Novosphingobium profundi]